MGGKRTEIETNKLTHTSKFGSKYSFHYSLALSLCLLYITYSNAVLQPTMRSTVWKWWKSEHRANKHDSQRRIKHGNGSIESQVSKRYHKAPRYRIRNFSFRSLEAILKTQGSPLNEMKATNWTNWTNTIEHLSRLTIKRGKREKQNLPSPLLLMCFSLPWGVGNEQSLVPIWGYWGYIKSW